MKPAGLTQPWKAVAVAVVLTAMSLVVLDAGMANIALPVLAKAFAAGPAETVLIITAYQTALVMALLPCAALGERYGNRTVLQAGLALFVAGSLLCAAAPSLPWLVAARFIQGLGGAAVMALGVAMLRAAVPTEQLGAAVGWNALTVALSSAAAPTLGALIVSALGWPWLFLVNLPIGALALTASRALPAVAGRGTALDLTSIALNGAAFGCLVLGAEALPKSLVSAAVLATTSALAFSLLLWRERSKVLPVVPFDLLGSRSFRLSVIASVCCFTGQAAAMVALPFYLQHELGLSPLAAGLSLSPWPLAVAATSIIAGRLSDRLPTAWLCAVGGAVLAVGLALSAMWPARNDAHVLMVLAAVCGVGFGLFQVPNNRNMFMAAPTERSGAAGGLQGTARLTGQTAGAVLMTILFVSAPMAAAPRLGLAIGGAIALLAGIVSLRRATVR